MAETVDSLERARSLVAEASRITVLTGAGISTDSGIPDFRGPQGVWTKNPEAEKQATLSHYLGSAEVRKRAWQGRVRNYGNSLEPNDGHRALLALEQAGKLHTLITQNVDGLHLKAGHDPARVVEIHGTVHGIMCMSCDERTPMEPTLDRVRAGEEDPPCLTCGGILKSATISFGQGLDHNDLMRSEVAAQECDLMLAVGTTLTVHPIAGVVPIAHQAGASIVIVNGQETAFDHIADAVVMGSISEVLPQILELS